jgi:hypothetical protein
MLARGRHMKCLWKGTNRMKRYRAFVYYILVLLLAFIGLASTSCKKEKQETNQNASTNSIEDGSQSLVAVTAIAEAENGVMWAVVSDVIYGNPEDTAIFVKDGDEWEKVFKPDDTIQQLLCGEGGAVYACGGKGVYRCESSVWELWYESHEILTGLTMIRPDDLWAVGAEGGIYHYDGSEWKLVERKHTYFTGIAAFNERNIWATGLDVDTHTGMIIYYDGSGWSSLNEGDSGSAFTSICVIDPQNVWVAATGYLLTYNGSSWEHAYPFGADAQLLVSIQAQGSSLWAAGGIWDSPYDENDQAQSMVYRYDGKSWTKQFEMPTFISALHVSDDVIWVGMQDSVVAKYVNNQKEKEYELR